MARHHYETLQQVFDDAYRGLAAQGFEQSLNVEGHCAYRSPDGRMCAIGHCLPDDLYSVTLEGFVVAADKTVFTDLFGPASDDESSLRSKVEGIQACHDVATDADDLQVRLVEFARANGLTIPSIEGAA